MIKPPAIEWRYEILKDLDKHFSRTKTNSIPRVPKEIIRKHYSIHRKKPFFEPMINEFINNPVLIALYEGEEGLIKKMREVIGPTNPLEAEPSTIRGKYKIKLEESGIEIIHQVKPNLNIIRNIIHASDSSQEAERELNVWKEYFI